MGLNRSRPVISRRPINEFVAQSSVDGLRTDKLEQQIKKDISSKVEVCKSLI